MAVAEGACGWVDAEYDGGPPVAGLNPDVDNEPWLKGGDTWKYKKKKLLWDIVNYDFDFWQGTLTKSVNGGDIWMYKNKKYNQIL